MQYDFVTDDDVAHVVVNPGVASLDREALARVWREPVAGLYIPVTYSVWGLQGAILHGLGQKPEENPWLFHLFNGLLHAVNCLLVYYLLVSGEKGRPVRGAGIRLSPAPGGGGRLGVRA